MRTVARTDKYVYEADLEKNRGYITLYGTWTNVGEVPEVLQDIEKLCNTLRPGFTVLCDFTRIQATALPDIFRKASEMVVGAGVKKFAALHERQTFMQAQMSHASKGQGFPGRVFYNREEAEAWLDDEGS